MKKPRNIMMVLVAVIVLCYLTEWIWGAASTAYDPFAVHQGNTLTGNVTATFGSGGATSVSVTGLTISSQAAGDVLYFNGTSWVRLAKGTAGQVLEMNAGATAPEWDTDDTGGAGDAIIALGVTASEDPDVTEEGRLAWDTGQDVLRGYAGVNQVVLAQATKTLQFTIMQPDDLDEKGPFTIWSNESGKTFYMKEIKAWCETDNADFGIYRHTSNDRSGANLVHMASVTVSLDGAGIYYQYQGSSTITVASGTLASGSCFAFAPTADDVKWIKVTLIGYFGADD